MHHHSFIHRAFSRISLVAALGVLMFSGVASFSVAPAQAPQPSPRSTGKPADRTEVPPLEKRLSAEEGKPESQETSGGENEIRHAPAVRWIAKHTGLSIDQAYWLSVILNFSVVAIAIFSLARKKLPVVFKNRTALIQKRIEEARKTSEEARRRLSEVEGRLSRLDVEIAGMRREAEDNAKAEERRVLLTVEAERKRIVESAEQEISTIADAARRDLKAYAGALAVDLAEKKIRVGKDTDQSLVREFTSHLGKDGN
jgi:F-type H+-transporting ATPase subunit b